MRLDGERKIAVLAKTLSGDLREIDQEGKERGKVFIRTLQCNFAELKGEDMKEAGLGSESCFLSSRSSLTPVGASKPMVFPFKKSSSRASR